MTITTFTSRQFNQDTSRAKQAALQGPVFITDRGRPAHVLLSIEHYQQLSHGGTNLVDLLAMDGDDVPAFEPGRVQGLIKPADLG